MSNTRSARSSTEPIPGDSDPSSDDSGSRTVIVKLGGSLLSLPNLFPRLQHVLSKCGGAMPLIVVGGGVAADSIRALQSTCGFCDRAAHDMAIAAMTYNAEHLHRLDRRFRIVSCREDAIRAHADHAIPLLRADTFVEQEVCAITETTTAEHQEPWHRPLPASWEITSDSIAAWTAARWPASELWLLKSCDPPPGDHSPQSFGQGVDAAFAHMLPPAIRLRWINLRANSFPAP